MNYLTVCAIVKDEAFYLEEWIEFHLLQGVEHFYMYDNVSSDETTKILDHYKEKGIVTWRNWPMQPGQKLAYNDYIRGCKSKTQWTACIDADEFLFAPGYDLRDFLKGYEDSAALAVNWYLFGSNGHKTYSPELVIERFTKRAKEVNQHVKTIFQSDSVLTHGDNVHAFKLRGPAVDEHKNELPIQYGLNPKGTADLIRINHYSTKSEEECRIRCNRWRCDINQSRDFAVQFPHHDVNEVDDFLAAKFIPVIKEKLRG